MKWIRVTKKDRCRICDRADWCTYSPEFGLALCMRIESDRPSNNSMGGWLFKIGEPRVFVQPRKIIAAPPLIDFESMWRRWLDSTEHYHLDGFAMSLGVDTDSLKLLGCAWNGTAWAFPMRDEKRKIIGVRLRDGHGNKWAVKGSKQGLFIPNIQAQKTLYILEGPTDAAAALTLGLYAIGRPSCLGCEEMVVKLIGNQKINRVVIVTDNDTPGLRGAAKLAERLPVPSCVWSPFCKDMREFVNSGGSRLLLESTLKDLVWQCPT